MKFLCRYVALTLLITANCAKQTLKPVYPEKFEGLTQLILATETKNLNFTDTTVSKILGFRVGSAQVKVNANVTFDFYLDFDKDGYTMKFSPAGDTLVFSAPPLRVKKPVINNSDVSYPEKSFMINEEEKAVQKLQTLTNEFIDEGEDLLKEDYVVAKCTEMLTKYLIDLCAKMGYSTKVIFIKFLSPVS